MYDRLCMILMAAAPEVGSQPVPEGPSPGPAAFLVQLMPMILIFAIMYLLLIRPQQKKAKEHRELLTQLKAGDQVVTNGGIYGTIRTVRERSLMVEIAPKVEVEVSRAAVAGLRGKEPAE